MAGKEKEDRNAYQRGYYAGRKVKRSLDGQRAAREDFIQRMMVSIAPQLIAKPWGKTVKGEFIQHTTGEQIMRTVRSIAVEAADLCDFSHAMLAERAKGEGDE